MEKGPTRGLEHILNAEKIYSFNFNGTRKVFYLSLHYNGANTDLFVNRLEMVKFKAKDSEIVATLKLWRRGVVVITTAQLHSTNSEFRFKPYLRHVGDSQW